MIDLEPIKARAKAAEGASVSFSGRPEWATPYISSSLDVPALMAEVERLRAANRRLSAAYIDYVTGARDAQLLAFAVDRWVDALDVSGSTDPSPTSTSTGDPE